MQQYNYIPGIIALLLIPCSVFALHNRVGEIIYTKVGSYTFNITIITYFKGVSIQADRDSLDLDFGDGKSQRIVRSNGLTSPSGVGQGEYLGFDIKKNLYTTTHTYPGTGQYKLVMEDPNRNQDSVSDQLSLLAQGEAFKPGFNMASATLDSVTNTMAFSWQPDSSRIRNHPYIFTFRGSSIFMDSIGLTKNYQEDLTLVVYVGADSASITNSIKEEAGVALEPLVYPNPSDGSSAIFIKGLRGNQTTFTLYDANGKVIMQEYPINGSQIQLGGQQLPTGIYHYQLNDKQEHTVLHTGKLLIH